ncbi:MAG: MDR/zinc-dependent alcohol dehydrogenase-like family protein [Blastocatellia bacterium]
MKALRFENNQLFLADGIVSPRRAGEALVRVTTAGVCNTDIEIVRGYAGFNGTLGHEFTGVVEDSPDPAQIGRRVVGEINAGCGACATCQAGDARHCLGRTVLGIVARDGAFANYLSLPPRNLLFIPDSVPDRWAVFTEPLAAACAILEQLPLDHTRRVAVIGDGKLGQLIARVLATTGCDLLLIGKHADKLRLAAGAGTGVALASDMHVAPADRFDVVVEASGAPGGLELALALVRARGVIVLKSTFSGKVELDTSRIVVDEITVMGSRCGRFADALHLLRVGAVDVEPLIAAEYALADGVAAMRHAGARGTLKVLLQMAGSGD